MTPTFPSLKDRLYDRLLHSPLGVRGVEQTLPALETLLREVKRDDFLKGTRPCRQAEEQMQMIRVWANYKQALRELRERLRQNQDWDDLLSWLTVFLIDHYRELARTSALHEPSFALAFDIHWSSVTHEQALVCRDDWQMWAVNWLRDTFRDEELDVGEMVKRDGQGGDDDDIGPENRPKPKLGDTSEFDY